MYSLLTLFLCQGGGLHHTPWEGIIQELRISEDPRRAEDYCLESTEVIMIDGEKKSGPPIAVHNIPEIQVNIKALKILGVYFLCLVLFLPQ